MSQQIIITVTQKKNRKAVDSNLSKIKKQHNYYLNQHKLQLLHYFVRKERCVIYDENGSIGVIALSCSREN